MKSVSKQLKAQPKSASVASAMKSGRKKRRMVQSPGSYSRAASDDAARRGLRGDRASAASVADERADEDPGNRAERESDRVVAGRDAQRRPHGDTRDQPQPA